MSHSIETQLTAVDWQSVSQDLHEKGYAVIRQLLLPEHCIDLIEQYADAGLYRKTIAMERYRFGVGEYKYFHYPLPPLLQTMRTDFYAHLVSVANAWMNVLKIDRQFPPTHEELLARCREQGQHMPTVLILKYGTGGYNTLHQDLYGDIYFPLQAVLFLNEPGDDYTGGEFVMTQQTPRAQSRAIVLQPRRGDVLIATTNFRPVKGSKGYYRAAMKHGVSEVHTGKRYTLGIIFHDAIT